MVSVAALAASIIACGGSAIKKDTRQLEKKCDIVRGDPVSEEDALCIGKIYGIIERRDCPIEIDRVDSFNVPAFRVLESCSGLAVIVAEPTGRVLALMSGEEIIHR